jgi:hypothetical protein
LIAVHRGVDPLTNRRIRQTRYAPMLRRQELTLARCAFQC